MSYEYSEDGLIEQATQVVYSDEEVSLKTMSVYQHIYSSYFGGGKSVYQQSA